MWKNATFEVKIRATHTEENFHPLIRDEHLRIFKLICFGVVNQMFAVFGMATNVINMICFVKQGFKESINISLLGLAVSDFGSLLTMTWINICMIPAFQEFEDLVFDPLDSAYLATGMPHIVLTRITSCITAFITLERCLCITMPLKVARIFTPRRVSFINLCIFAFFCISISPIYYVGWYGMKYFPDRNKTMIGLIFASNKETVELVSLAINSVLLPFSAFFIVLICMTITVVKLYRQTKWRQRHAGGSKTEVTSVREQKVAKMVLTISVLFVICFCPSVVIFLASLIEPEFWFEGRYYNMLAVSYGISTVFESTNASMNIFIYYKMSTRFKACFRQLFCSTEIKSVN